MDAFHTGALQRAREAAEPTGRALDLPIVFQVRLEVSPTSVSRLILRNGHIKVWSTDEKLVA